MVSEARRILQYYELPKQQQPPPAIWHSVHKCNKWIEEHMPGQDSSNGMIELDESEIQ